MLKLFIFQSWILCLHFALMKGLSNFFSHLWLCLSSLLYFHFGHYTVPYAVLQILYLGFNIFRKYLKNEFLRLLHCLTIIMVKLSSRIWVGLRSNSVSDIKNLLKNVRNKLAKDQREQSNEMQSLCCHM